MKNIIDEKQLRKDKYSLYVLEFMFPWVVFKNNFLKFKYKILALSF